MAVCCLCSCCWSVCVPARIPKRQEGKGHRCGENRPVLLHCVCEIFWTINKELLCQSIYTCCNLRSWRLHARHCPGMCLPRYRQPHLPRSSHPRRTLGAHSSKDGESEAN